MDENNKYCACTGTDAKFHITLNQQGPEGKQGPQGIKGVDGISPSISVESSTQDNYQLRISTAYNTFVTPNLKGDDKVQIDPFTLTKPGDIPEFGLNKTVTNNDIIDGIVTIPGGLGFSININDYADESHSIKPQYRFPITTTIKQYGIIIGKSTSYLLTNNSITANNPIMLTRNKDGSVTLDFDDTNYQHKLTAGSNINITDNTISVTGIPTKVSDLTNDAGYLTSIPSEYVTDSELTAKGYITDAEVEAKNYATKTELSTVAEQVVTTQSDVADLDSTVSTLKPIVEDNTTAIGSINDSIAMAMEDITDLRETKNDNIFDISKFTVVGTPTIADDGVIQKQEVGGMVETTSFTELNSSTTNFEIISPLLTLKDNSNVGREQYFWCDRNNILRSSVLFPENVARIRYLNNSGAVKEFKLSVPGTSGTTLQTKIAYRTGVIYGYAKINGGEWVLIGSDADGISDTIIIAKMRTKQGALDADFSFTDNALIDLKYAKVTVDGKEVFNGLMESTKPIYDKITSTNTQLSNFELDTNNNFSAVNSALNEKANLSDLSGYVTLTKYNELLDRVTALETEINGGNA